MEYDDNKISTPDEFDELAKEYKNHEFQNFDKIFEKLFTLGSECATLFIRRTRNFRFSCF